ncbi:MAG TPA: hypothetical protein VLF09_09235 [Cellvibrio sp.]|nr:hypothetical protein [Cellvibrio sp.]
MRRFFGVLISAVIAASSHADVATSATTDPATKPLVITLKLPDFGDLKRKTFEHQLIELALQKTQGKTGGFEMASVNVISRTHAVAALSQNLYQNFITTLSYEDTLLDGGNLIYIPFPVERGALSYRICYANKNLDGTIQTIDDLKKLKQYKLGIGAGWLDAKILQHSGLQTVEGNNITSLFRMTQAGRADIFCPSPSEYFHELAAEKISNLQLDNKLALYYPLPKFLFSHKSNQALLDRIKHGIDIAYQDGSYLELWNRAYARDLLRAKLSERNLIKLENPFITNLPNDYEHYLFDPLTR